MYRHMYFTSALAASMLVASASAQEAEVNESGWYLMLSHDKQGNVREGSRTKVVRAVRNGCQLRVAWGSVRTAEPRRSIEHVAEPSWVSVRNDQEVQVQIGDFVINLAALGEPEEDHPRRAEYGGTQQVVKWSANLKTDGSFDAVWYAPHSGEFIVRRPQRHPMKWFADCQPEKDEPLYMEPEQ